MNDTLTFSVAMCVYGKDNPEHFRIAVDSILNQTRKPDEVVLVVDGPVEGQLAEIISDYEAMPLFNVVRLAENKGHGEARRISLEHCSHALVALMDADDISASNRFELQLAEFAKNRALDIVGGNITEFIDTPDSIVGRRVVPEGNAAIKEYLKTRCPFNQVTVMFRKSAYDAAGGYIDWFCEEDYYLWLRMHLQNATFANISADLVNVRVGKEMYQRRGGWKYFASEARLQGYMLSQKIISYPTYISNVAKRLIVQVLLPNSIRGWVFRKFARSNAA